MSFAAMRSRVVRVAIIRVGTVQIRRDRPGRRWSDWDIRKHTHLLYAIAPNASILVQEQHMELILTTPLSIDQTRIEIMTIAPKPGPGGFSEKARGFLSANHAFTKKTLDEDWEIAE
jgi:hypothetical protein